MFNVSCEIVHVQKSVMAMCFFTRMQEYATSILSTGTTFWANQMKQFSTKHGHILAVSVVCCFVLVMCLLGLNISAGTGCRRAVPGRIQTFGCIYAVELYTSSPSSARREHQIPAVPRMVGQDAVSPVRSVRDLGIHLNCNISMRTHIVKTVSSCFAVLRQIRSISRSVTWQVLVSLVEVVVSLVLTRLDYGSVTLAGLPDSLLNSLQSVLNAVWRRINLHKSSTMSARCFVTSTGCESVSESSSAWQSWSTAAYIIRRHLT